MVQDSLFQCNVVLLPSFILYTPNNQNSIKKSKTRIFFIINILLQIVNKNKALNQNPVKKIQFYAHIGSYPPRGCSGSATLITFISKALFITKDACAAFFLSIPKRLHKLAFFILSPSKYFIIEC